MAASDIVKKLWSLCDVLRDSGVNYANYVNELVQLMFLKMVKDHLNNGLITEDPIPEGCRFDDLLALSGTPLINAYKQALTTLSSGELADGSQIENLDPRVRAIYTDAQTSIKEPKHLEYLIKNLDEINWDSEDRDVLGAAYEGLLEKNANETKSGAGQYFTPRALINSMVKLIKPQHSEIIQDPAAGSAGFIISADRYIKNETDDLIDLTSEERTFQRTRAYEGMELVANTRRLALMNCLLHGIEGIGEGVIHLGNTLSTAGQKLEPADIIGKDALDLFKERDLRSKAFFRTGKDLFLDLFELVRHEPLGVGKRLFALVAVRHFVAERVGDFDPVTEHAVVFDLQVFDARLFTFARLHFRDAQSPVFMRVAKFVQFLTVPFRDIPALLDVYGRIGYKRALQ